MIEEGTYYIKANEIQESNAINRKITFVNMGNLGDKYIKLYKNKDDKEPKNTFSLFGTTTTAYTIHGGKSYGDNKGIDLAHNDLAFFKALQKLTNKYKVELENTKHTNLIK